MANLELNGSKIEVYGQIQGATEKTVAQILEKLFNDGDIEAFGQTGITTITGMSFGIVGTDGVTIAEEATSEEILATFTSSNPSQDYYVQIRGKKYPIAKTNGVIKITKTEIQTGTNATGEITEVSSSNTSFATVSIVSGTTDKIKITGVAKGTAIITAKYTNEIYATIPVTVKGNVAITLQSNNDSYGTVATTVNGSYLEGTQITLSDELVTPGSKYKFDGWYINNEKLTLELGNKYTVPTDGTISVSIVAKFVEKPNIISESTSGVGYYIKKGNEYAVVFADLVAQAGSQLKTDTNWDSDPCIIPSLTDEQKSGYKTYKINGQYTDTNFGTKYVLEVEDDVGKDRFMALALTDYISKEAKLTWYSSAADGKMTDYSATGGTGGTGTPTSKAFGKGEKNTEIMLKKGITGGYGTLTNSDIWYKLMNGWTDSMKANWNAKGYNAVDGDEMWGKVGEGWFVPSYQEWKAFYCAMNSGSFGGSKTYKKLGLYILYWSSSQLSNDEAYYWVFANTYSRKVNNSYPVRLATSY